MDVPAVGFVRLGRNTDGGYVQLDDGGKTHAVYSIGIGGDVSWDAAMADCGIEIWQYDHTVAGPPQTHPRFHFQPLGVAAVPSADGTLRTLASLIVENGHAGRRDLILKIDIEGGEWDVFASMPAEQLEQFSQIVLEFHDLHRLNEADRIWRVLEVLTHLHRTHQSVHVHANNWGTMVTIGGITLPDVIEVTYARRSDHTFIQCHRIFPTPLDFPNNPERADLFLGVIGFNGTPSV
jgi:hypothetical protein